MLRIVTGQGYLVMIILVESIIPPSRVTCVISMVI